MKNLQDNLEGLTEHYLEMLKHLGRMLDINIESIREGKTSPKLHGECFVVEDVINAFEVKIKEECITTIARFQPAARNLRQLIMFIDGARLVERMADILKANFLIVKHIEEVNPALSPKVKEYFTEYLRDIKELYDSYLLAFSNSDQDILYSLISADDKINKETDAISEKIVELIKGEPESTKDLMKMYSLGKKYERFADHIIHLVIDLVYILKGENLRKKELLELEGKEIDLEREANRV